MYIESSRLVFFPNEYKDAPLLELIAIELRSAAVVPAVSDRVKAVRELLCKFLGVPFIKSGTIISRRGPSSENLVVLKCYA